MKSLIAVYSLCLAAGLMAVRADDASQTSKNSTSTSSSSSSTTERKRPALTDEQKQARKDLLAKYDTNKDGKLDKEERQKISDEDKAKLKKAGLSPRLQKKAAKSSTTTTTTTTSPSK